jgi:glycine cleavage system regulatory protein
MSESATPTPTSSRYIVHASGIDRLWIVNDVAEKVIEGGGNVAESKASKLGQYFSIMMLVDLPKPDDVADMTKLLSSLPDLNVAVFEAMNTQARPPSIACKLIRARE